MGDSGYFVYTMFVDTATGMEAKPAPHELDIAAAALYVHTQIGQVHSEGLVSKALCEELKEKGFVVEREAPIQAWFSTSTGKRRFLETLKADVVVSRDDKTYLLELKALNATPANQEAATRQVQCYLRFGGRHFDGAYAIFFQRKVGEAPCLLRCTAL